MSLNLQPQNTAIRLDERGTARIGRSRVTLDLVIAEFLDGASPEEIVNMYTSLDLADVYDVIAYYLRHKSEVDAYLDTRQEQAEATRKKIEAEFDPTTIRGRLLARLDERES